MATTRQAFSLCCIVACSLFVCATAGNAVEDTETATPESLTATSSEGSSVSTTASAAAANWRLPNTSYPLSYDIHIATQLHSGIHNYTGNCSILLHVQSDTSQLYLHAKNLSIITATFRDEPDAAAASSAAAAVAYVPATDMIVLSAEASDAAQTFRANHTYRVDLMYAGVITSQTVGFHVITATDADNSSVIGAMTMFEPTHARSFVPCYDEPAYKANFTLHVTHANNYTVISNMPQLMQRDVEGEPGMLTTQFMTTPAMPTYSLAFVLFEMDAYINYTIPTQVGNSNIAQRIFVPNALSAYSVNTTSTIAPLALQAISDYLDYPYVLPKLDHIAVTKMYGAGMENWGLITYKYKILLDELEVMPHWRTFTLTMTLAHELTHQWLGNLVTPIWWDQVWLSEGLGSYLSYVVVDMIRPERDNIYLLECPRSYMGQSELLPIVRIMEKPQDIVAIFDSGVYRRAPCMLDMLQHALGADIFREGLRLYINRHAYTAVTEQQFHDALQTAAIAHYAAQNQSWPYDIAAIFESWTHSSSYPILSVTRDYAQQTLTIRQFAQNESASTQRWWIPLQLSSPQLPVSTVIYMPPVPEWTVELKSLNMSAAADDWLTVGMQNKEIYKVFYDIENMRRLATALLKEHTKIDRHERAALLCHQAQNLRYYDNEQTLLLFELLGYLGHEEDIYVWTMAARTLGELVEHFQGRRALVPMRQYFQQLSQPVMSQYSGSDKKALQNLNMQELDLTYALEFHLGCFILMSACLERAAALFPKGYEKLDIENTKIACIIGKGVSEQMFESFLSMHFKENYTTSSDTAVLNILKCTPHDALYEQLLVQVLRAEGCSEIFARLNVIFNKIEFNRVQQTLDLLDAHISDILQDMRGSCEQYEQFLRHLRVYCQKANAYKLMNVSKLCVQQQALGQELEDTYDSLEYYDALDEQLYKWLMQRLGSNATQPV